MGKIFVTIDLENLLVPSRREGRLGSFLDLIVATVRRLGGNGTLMGGIAIGDRDLQIRAAWPLNDVGVRAYARKTSGSNAADIEIVEVLDRELPASADTIVIGSGDGIFAPVADRLVKAGRRIEIIALPGHVSRDLRRIAHGYTPLILAPAAPASRN